MCVILHIGRSLQSWLLGDFTLPRLALREFPVVLFESFAVSRWKEPDLRMSCSPGHS